MCSSGYSVCLGGSLGGKLGGGRLLAGAAVMTGDALPVPSPRRTGGFGRFAVESPVVSARYGVGGALGLESSSSSASCRCWCKAICCGVKAAPRPRFDCISGLGGGGRDVVAKAVLELAGEELPEADCCPW